jgi:hypothetical protein
MSTTARSLRNEADYLPGDLAELVQLRADVIAAGHSRRVADGLCTWLIAKAASESDTTSANTRSKYRRILSEIAGQPPNRPGSGKPPIILVGDAVMSSRYGSLGGVISRELELSRRSAAGRKARRFRRS